MKFLLNFSYKLIWIYFGFKRYTKLAPDLYLVQKNDLPKNGVNTNFVDFIESLRLKNMEKSSIFFFSFNVILKCAKKMTRKKSRENDAQILLEKQTKYSKRFVFSNFHGQFSNLNFLPKLRIFFLKTYKT